MPTNKGPTSHVRVVVGYEREIQVSASREQCKRGSCAAALKLPI